MLLGDSAIIYSLYVYFAQVPADKMVKVSFIKFLLSEPGQNEKDCRKDYVEINKQR